MKVAIISDVHANIHALNVVLNDLEKENVTKILVAGDLIGYYYWPSEVLKIFIKDDRFICIRGNHENILQEGNADQQAASRYRKKYGSGYDFCRNELSESEMNWLLSLPKEKYVTLDGTTFYLGHGSLGSTDEYLYPDAPLKKLLENYSNARYTIFGHTHYPFLHQHEDRYLLNPGSVGQPRDSGGLASYLVVDTENQVVKFKRKSFDIDLVVRAAKANDPSLGYLSSIMKR